MSADSRQAKLVELLGTVQDEPGLENLEDRALDAGHLGEDDYPVVLERRTGHEGYENLRRHVLFCPVCSREFLRRAAPEAEEEFAELDRKQQQRRRLFLLIGIGVAVAAVVGLLLLAQGGDGEEPSRGPTASGFWAGLGSLAGLPGLAPGRLYLTVPDELAADRGLFVYAFVLRGLEAEPLHPDDAAGLGNPLSGPALPAGGWPDPGADPEPWLLCIVTPEPLPTLGTAGDRSTFARSLEIHLRAGREPEEIARLLGPELLDDDRGRMVALPVNR